MNDFDRASLTIVKTDLRQAAAECLQICNPEEKCKAVAALAAAFQQGDCLVDAAAPDCAPELPGRPERPGLVDASQVPRRRIGSEAGRAALVHAIAHIEFNAINLALDAVCRFDGMPDAYYADWLSVAEDEARHFELLRGRLLDLGSDYGDFDAHNGLWEMAEKTAHQCLVRMALVPRVLEARGLDVTPGMIARLRSVGDLETVCVLEVILEEEIRHVAIGSRWFRFCCEREGLAPEPTFIDLLKTYYADQLKGPFNLDARLAAGFSEEEMNALSNSECVRDFAAR